MADPSIRVVVADDDPSFRAVYRKLFDRTEGFRLEGEAGDGAEAVRLVRAYRPDVALLDVQMPRRTGLEAAREILQDVPGVRVVMLTTFDLDEYVHEALGLGVSGFLLKNASPQEVLTAVRTAHAGHALLAPEVTARLIRQLAPPLPDRRHAFVGQLLTAREIDVVRLVARGLSNQEVADELVLSTETVRTYLRRMFVKLGVKDRTHLAVLAYEAGLLHETR
ncbi:MAG: response regulator transcription factor [Cellulomonas sp.]|uniref:response regulator n=1 Tax=unclassified Cellulomonas TaxID=2620175 RepID=UPI000652851D|nr:MULTISPECIES: response regulator transcription factor [unclassified Cellulomonas]KMM45067.1 LuxR family transcriptional regulator [Cellulomonas sp. A375-1]MCR6648890.1 response regulator transcription factor [Cellulomonas sp.]MCR6704869.1 response regulator transcription factor [Cellulomonas sp.]